MALGNKPSDFLPAIGVFESVPPRLETKSEDDFYAWGLFHAAQTSNFASGVLKAPAMLELVSAWSELAKHRETHGDSNGAEKEKT